MSVTNIIDISRLKELIDTKTREEIAEGIGCDTSTVTKHYTESRAVNIEYLKKYAEFFNVSADYLLGLTNASVIVSSDEKRVVREICDYTGLAEYSIASLHLWKELVANDEFCNKYPVIRGVIADVDSFLDHYILHNKPISEEIGQYYRTFKTDIIELNKLCDEMRAADEEYRKHESNAEELEEKSQYLTDYLTKAKEHRKYRYFCICEEYKKILNSYFDEVMESEISKLKEISSYHDYIISEYEKNN